jgi:hypothetical protein
MAVGVFNGRATITGSAQSLDSITGTANTYSYLAVKAARGSVLIGNSGITLANGYPVDNDEDTIIPVSSTGASLFFIGNGELEFFGISTA